MTNEIERSRVAYSKTVEEIR